MWRRNEAWRSARTAKGDERSSCGRAFIAIGDEAGKGDDYREEEAGNGRPGSASVGRKQVAGPETADGLQTVRTGSEARNDMRRDMSSAPRCGAPNQAGP